MERNMKDKIMCILENIRKAIRSSLSFEKGLKAYNKTLSELESLKDDLTITTLQQENIKKGFNTALQEYPGKLEAFNRKYNDQFGDYIKSVEELKKGIATKTELLSFYKSTTIGLENWLEELVGFDKLLEHKEYKYKKYLEFGLGFMRENLPQISYKEISEILSILNDEKITINKASVPINILKPSQINFSEKKIQNILRKGMDDKEFIPLVSRDLFLIDGQHRWASLLEQDEDQISDVYYINMNAKELIEKIKNFKEKESSIKLLKKAIEEGVIPEIDFKKIENGTNS